MNLDMPGAFKCLITCQKELRASVRVDGSGYDSQGRRFEKKVSVAGTIVLHERYAYREFLQVAAFDVLGTSENPNYTLKRVIYWDSTAPIATRPLALNVIQNGAGTLYFPTVDLTKNVCELVDFYGNVAVSYDYAPFGSCAETLPAGTFSAPENPFRFSSEFYDSELDLVYYNFRHYSPALGRFLSRDPIAERGGWNLYAFVGNSATDQFDELGRIFGWIPVLGTIESAVKVALNSYLGMKASDYSNPCEGKAGKCTSVEQISGVGRWGRKSHQLEDRRKNRFVGVNIAKGSSGHECI